MAQARVALATVLDTVVTTSNAVCTTISTIGKSAQFAGNWMDAVLKQQSIKLAADCEIFEQTYAETRAVELAQARVAIDKYVGDNARNKELYELSLGQIRAAIDKVKPRQQ